MTKKVIVIGAGGHATVCKEIIDSTPQFSFAGFVGLANDSEHRLSLGVEDHLPEIRHGISEAVIGLGQFETAQNRKRIFELLRELGFSTPALVSPFAVVAMTAEISEGTVVCPGVIVGPEVKIGRCAILNTSSVVEHHCRIGEFCHIAPNAAVNGGVSIGDCSFVGSGAVVVQNTVLPSGSFVKAGSVVK